MPISLQQSRNIGGRGTCLVYQILCRDNHSPSPTPQLCLCFHSCIIRVFDQNFFHMGKCFPSTFNLKCQINYSWTTLQTKFSIKLWHVSYSNPYRCSFLGGYEVRVGCRMHINSFYRNSRMFVYCISIPFIEIVRVRMFVYCISIPFIEIVRVGHRNAFQFLFQ